MKKNKAGFPDYVELRPKLDLDHNEIKLQKFYECFDDYFDDYFEKCGYDEKFYTLFRMLCRDIYFTICRYGLDREELLNFFKKNNDDVDYEVVQHLQNCFKNDCVSGFIN